MDFQDEDSKVEFLTSMMGNDDSEAARRALRRSYGNVETAAQSLLEENVGSRTINSDPGPKTPPRELVHA